jgi:hypothetical protein
MIAACSRLHVVARCRFLRQPYHVIQFHLEEGENSIIAASLITTGCKYFFCGLEVQVQKTR